jgi:protein-S-isoprenylcysteine O-methyltransferase Ste14
MTNSVISIPEKGIIFKIAKSRVIVSRIFGLLVLLFLLFTGHSFSQQGLMDFLFEMIGLFLLSICSIGRLWALMYISGNKRQELITDGPYSIVRHPMYVFSLIGAIGIGFASENLLVLALIIIFYLFYYPFTILAEEKKLTNKFGQAYLDYMARTPRFLPKPSLYKEPEIYQVKAASFVRNFTDGMWFIWIFLIIHLIEMLQDSGFLPVIWRIP